MAGYIFTALQALLEPGNGALDACIHTAGYRGSCVESSPHVMWITEVVRFWVQTRA